MKSNLLMNFNVDRSSGTLMVTREFNAPVENVWAAWTQSELLDQWWAPKPWKARTKTMDFREGGYWLYAMVGPDGTEHWGRNDYESITPLKSFTARDSFCDENGKINTELPGAFWKNTFRESSGITTVTILSKYDSPEDLEKVLEMGMQEGFTAALSNLDELLKETISAA